jgi:hypothetical protein
MPVVNITVEICCLKPSWVHREDNIYRLYANNDLLTERTWIWKLNTAINENIWVDIPSNSTNSIRLELILKDKSVAQFALHNFTVVNQPFTFEQINEHTISFILQ